MKTTLLALILCTVGCGAVYNDDTTTIAVSAPDGADVSVDGIPYGHARSLRVDAHHDHIIAAQLGQQVLGHCTVRAEIQGRYILGDVLLLEMVFPIVLDAATGDWATVAPTTCVFR